MGLKQRGSICEWSDIAPLLSDEEGTEYHCTNKAMGYRTCNIIGANVCEEHKCRCKQPERVLVTGDRNWTDINVIRRELSFFKSPTVIIHGACEGADMVADKVARELGLTVLDYPADWEAARRRGNMKSAGPIRNRFMFKDAKPTQGIAFHPNILTSRGTKDMVLVLVKGMTPYRVVPK